MKRTNLPFVLMWFTGGLLLGLAGCGSGDFVGTTYPVKGKVTINGKPVDHGSVAFWPDSAKGNNAKYEATAIIGADGTYTLTTRDKPGAAPGAYKITVAVGPTEKIDNTKPTSRKESEVPVEYTKKETTKLSVEVVAAPAAGAYDLDVKK